MLRTDSVFIVGAGASNEFGLPVGSELALRISDKLDIRYDEFGHNIVTGDKDLFHNIIQGEASHEAAQYQQAAWRIRDGIILSNSIDDFLHVHRADERIVKVGKAAVAKCILEAEKESALYFEPSTSRFSSQQSINFRDCSNTWLVKLMRLLTRELPSADRAKIFEKCTFIIFNYDRCVEYFFVHALQGYYGIQENEALEIVSKANILHAYGTPGILNGLANSNQTAFGQTRADYTKISGAISTYGESVDSVRAKSAIANAKRLYFLGFAYHTQNLQFLADDESIDIKSGIGTAWQMSENDIEATKYELKRWQKKPLQSADPRIQFQTGLKAAQIFDFYSKTI